MVGSQEERMEGAEGDEGGSNGDQALVRAGYRSLMEDITTNEEELGDVSGQCQSRLLEYMAQNQALFQQVMYQFCNVLLCVCIFGLFCCRPQLLSARHTKSLTGVCPPRSSP